MILSACNALPAPAPTTAAFTPAPTGVPRFENTDCCLETFAAEVEGGLAPERAVLSDYGTFFRDFADACHHGKEEDVLFQRMVERGFSRETGPVAVMLYEHKVGRGHVSALRQAGDGTGPLPAMESQLVLENAGAFIPLLRAHIQKEDRNLYPMAVRLLTGPALDAMETEFEALEARLRSDGSYDRLRGLADRLTAAFRPDPARIAAAAQIVGCGG